MTDDTDQTRQAAPDSIPTIVNAWPTRRDLANDLTAYTGIPVNSAQVAKWARPGGSIPARFHMGVIVCAEKRGINVSADVLARVHDVRDAAA